MGTIDWREHTRPVDRGLQVPAIPLSTKRLQLSDCARLPPPRRGWTGPARIPPPQGPCEGREAMETVIVCAVTTVLSSAVTLVAYACCVAAGNADRIDGEGE